MHYRTLWTCQSCSDKLHLQSYLEMLWSKTGYFGLLGNKHILYIILLYIIERYRFIGLKQWIWEDPTGTMVSVGQFCWNNGVSGKWNRDKYCGTYCTRYDTLVRFLLWYVCTWSHTLNNFWFLVSGFCKEHGSIIT